MSSNIISVHQICNSLAKVDQYLGFGKRKCPRHACSWSFLTFNPGKVTPQKTCRHVCWFSSVFVRVHERSLKVLPCHLAFWQKYCHNGLEELVEWLFAYYSVHQLMWFRVEIMIMISVLFNLINNWVCCKREHYIHMLYFTLFSD